MALNFKANTCWCVDFGVQGFPVTTLGMKAIDATVSDLDEAYILVQDNNGDPTNLESFIQSQAQYNSNPVLTPPSSIGIYRFNPVYAQNMPIRLRSPEVTADSPHLRKRWRTFLIHGDGTAQIRIYLDGVIITFPNGNTSITVTATEQPTHPRRILLPVGSWGYSISYEIVGDIAIRAIELGYDLMTAEE